MLNWPCHRHLRVDGKGISIAVTRDCAYFVAFLQAYLANRNSITTGACICDLETFYDSPVVDFWSPSLAEEMK